MKKVISKFYSCPSVINLDALSPCKNLESLRFLLLDTKSGWLPLFFCGKVIMRR